MLDNIILSHPKRDPQAKAGQRLTKSEEEKCSKQKS
jgi:hypothetical protein